MQNEIQSEADAQAAQIVTERLDEITERAKRVIRRTNTNILGLMLCFIITVCFFSLCGGPHNIMWAKLLIAYGGAMIIALRLTLWIVMQSGPRFDADEIARLGGARAVSPLCVTLDAPMPVKQRRAIHKALTLLLPQMKASEANLLTPLTRTRLYSWLSLNLDGTFALYCPIDLRIATLKALEQVGDAAAIPVVERLAKRKARTRSRTLVRQAAIDCLPMLRANCGEVEAARTLLRASQPETTDPKTLLRPASGAGQTDNAELLRGAQSPETQSESGE